ncbi:MAG TPA: VWA domain-containing protein [Steroidobacteraceae bacterium]|nr:VWA domain-containing protein [Steroidobacteraceae bacterium]
MMFSHPAWLAAGGLSCCFLIWLWRRYDARQYAALEKFVSPHLRSQLTQSVSIGRRRAQRGLVLASLALLFIALAGPLVGFRWELVSRRGNEIVFAVDTSRSMSTPDVKPDRLTRAKLAIDDFTNKLDGDAVGLVAFAGNAFLVCPITLDYGAFHESLNAIDINTIPRGGTNIASAIREAQAAVRRRPGSDKILILVTDGEDLEGDALVAAQAAARQDGLKIYTIGVGTPQGDLIPLTASPNGGFVKDESGGFVKSRLDEPALKAIAAATGGLYAPLGSQAQGFETIYTAGLAPTLKHDLASRRQRVYIERYQWPLAGSMGLLLTSLLVGSRRRIPSRRRHEASAPQPSRIDPSVASILIVLSLSLSPPGLVRASTTRAEDAYKKGDFATAANEYAAAAKSDPKLPALQFNAGTAAYRAGQFPQAAQAFQESINRALSADAKRLADQEDAYYNLGNTLYRTGQKTEESAPQQTLEAWNQAVKAYDTALQLRRDDADSKYNRDLVKRKIEELKQKQNQQPNQNQNQNQNQAQNQQQPNAGGQPPPNQQPPNQPPPGQQPPNQQPANQPPPPGAQQPPPNQPPPAAGQPRPNEPEQSPPDQPKPNNGQPKPAAGNGEPPPPVEADAQRLPGQMSAEEARELLDSQKGEERHALGMPVARRDPDAPPDKPVKDW